MFREVESILDRIRFLLRIAGYTNQSTVARRLSRAIATAEMLELKVSFCGKPGMGAARLARDFEQSLPHVCRLNSTVLESSTYRDLPREMLAAAREAGAIVFLVPAAAPFLDETLEFLASEVPSGRQERMIVITSADPALVDELAHSVADVTVCGEDQFIPLLTDACLREAVQAIEADLRRLAPAAARDLRPSVEAFAAFLALPQPRYLRRVDYIRRDLDALAGIARRSHDFLNQQIESALAPAAAAVRAIVPAMRQQAEIVVQQSVLPKDAATSDARQRFGQRTAAAARTAGYREFAQRVQAIAMRLNSARSILLTTMEQFRAEILPHAEELACNLGSNLFTAWMREAGFEWAEHPFDLALDPGVDFPDLIAAAATRIRQSIPEQEFVAGWQSRLDAVLRAEIGSAATAGWTPAAVDQPLTAAIDAIWSDTAQRACGQLVGRLDALVRVVNNGVASTRVGSLRFPRDPDLRMQAAGLYRGFASELNAISAEVPA
jgi:hypothetical protein